MGGAGALTATNEATVQRGEAIAQKDLPQSGLFLRVFPAEGVRSCANVI